MLLEKALEHRAVQTTQPAMGTVMTHKVYGPHARESLAAACAEIARIEGLLSRFLPESDVSRVNRSAGLRCEPVYLETFEVLSAAAAFSQASPGSFDVTIAPLVRLWSESKRTLTPPDADSIRRALPLVDSRDLMLDTRGLTAGLRRSGQSVDLGGIGKGYAGDRILEVFREWGVTSAYSNLGGNVVTLGAKPDGSPWRIGIQHPRQEERLMGVVSVVGQSVVTSGDYQRCFTDRSGQRWHHILDPISGYPAQAGLISVSIIAENSLAADALSTMVFVAGMEKGLECLRRFSGTEAILVDEDLHVFVTSELRGRFQAADDVAVTVIQ